MTDQSKTHQELIAENSSLKKKIKQLERLRSEDKQEKTIPIESENQFRTMVEESHAFLMRFDLNGTISYMNEATAKAIGCDNTDEFIGKSFLNLIHPDDRQRIQEAFTNQIKKRLLSDAQEFRIIHTKGEVRWFNFITTLEIEDGQITGQNGVGQDITERKRVEGVLLESETRYQSILDASPDNITITDINGRILMMSPAGLLMLGYDKEEDVKGEIVSNYLIPEDRSRALSNLALKAQGVLSRADEYRGLRKDGSIFDVEVMSNFIRDSKGTPTEAIIVSRDITERKQVEEERKKMQAQLQQALKMEAIGTLAGGIAHDFNNILGAILGYTEMAYEDSLSDSVNPDDLNQILLASLRAKELVKQILAFSRQTVTEERVLQPAIIVRETIEMLRASLPTTIDIQKNIDPDNVGLVLADPTQIHQIITNLCTNAFHAMEETGGSLNISLKNQELTSADLVSEAHVRPGDFVEISVSDTGPGIAPEIMDKVFDPFFTTKEVGVGTGMGLSIIHGIAKKTGGFVSCKSSLGEGTTFLVYLPVHTLTAPPESNTTFFELSQTGFERILFIDDEEMLAKMGKTMLERLGYRVTVETSSLEALKIIQNQPDRFDLIITDQTMPGMTGSDLAQHILQIRPEMPIILCTGFSNQISEKEAKPYGIKGFAFKPLAKKDLSDLVRKVLGDKK